VLVREKKKLNGRGEPSIRDTEHSSEPIHEIDSSLSKSISKKTTKEPNARRGTAAVQRPVMQGEQRQKGEGNWRVSRTMIQLLKTTEDCQGQKR